jgi:hypothetical protein
MPSTWAAADDSLVLSKELCGQVMASVQGDCGRLLMNGFIQLPVFHWLSQDPATRVNVKRSPQKSPRSLGFMPTYLFKADISLYCLPQPQILPPSRI